MSQLPTTYYAHRLSGWNGHYWLGDLIVRMDMRYADAVQFYDAFEPFPLSTILIANTVTNEIIRGQYLPRFTI